MKTIVKIEWDQPQDQNWLNPDNIALALHAYCRNTKFKVTKLNKLRRKSTSHRVSSVSSVSFQKTRNQCNPD